MFTFMDVAVIPVLLSAVLSMVLGFFWYSPMLFGKKWAKLRGYSEKALKAEQSTMGPKYMLSFLAALVTMWMLGKCIVLLGAIGPYEGMQVAFMLWLGFITTVQLTGWIFSSYKKELYFIDTGYQLALMLVGGIVLGLWA